VGQPASRRVVIAFFSLLTAGMHCGDPAQLALGRPFSLRFGESAVFEKENVRLRFDSVPEDSRCPKKVQCVSAGNARIRLEITVGSATPSVVELNTARGPREAEIEGFRIVLEDLAPYPLTSQPIPAEEFLATLSVLRI
jgi:hypothetical protein